MSYGSLEVNEDFGFQQRFWRLQRMAWIGMAMIVTAALLGLLGSGPLSRTVQSGQDFSVEYERFGRYEALMVLRVSYASKPAHESVRVFLDHPYLDKAEVVGIVPDPMVQLGGPDGITYVFPVHALTNGSATFYLTFRTIGRVEGRVAVDDGPPVSIAHFLYP
jgi:hypothetical protein